MTDTPMIEEPAEDKPDPIIVAGKNTVEEVPFNNVVPMYIYFDPTKAFQQLFAVALTDGPVKKLFNKYSSLPDKFTSNPVLTSQAKLEETDVLDGDDALLVQLSNLKQFIYLNDGYFPVTGTEISVTHSKHNANPPYRIVLGFSHIEVSDQTLIAQLDTLKDSHAV